MKMLMELFTKYNFFFFVFIFTLLAALPLLHPGLIPTHDGEYHLIRFYEFDKVLRLGYFYPRWAPDLDFSYGVPLFTYVYPLPNYVASILHVFGASFLDSVKLNMFLAMFVGALLMFLWAKEFWGKMGGLVSAIFYTYAPYHFVDIYIRGSVGEVWALALFPGFLWAYTKFASNKKWQWAALASIFLALVIFSHNILGLMFFGFSLTYITFVTIQKKQKVVFLLSSFFILLLGLGLSAIFWLPALFETNAVTGLQIYNIAQNFPDLFQLLFPSWGSGFFGTDPGNEMSVQIGVANLLVIFASIMYFVRLMTKKQKANALLMGFFLAWLVVLVCCMLSFSLPLWDNVPLIHYFQFPWRLLSLVILVCAFLAGAVATWKKSLIASTILILLVVGTTYTYTQPAYYMLRSDAYYASRSNFIDGTNSPGNSFNTIWGITQTKRPTSLFVNLPNAVISNFKTSNQLNFSMNITAAQAITQVVNVSYFPNWFVYEDRHQLTIFPTNGLLSFKALKGTHTYQIVFQQTLIENIATIIFAVTFILLLFLLLRRSVPPPR